MVVTIRKWQKGDEQDLAAQANNKKIFDNLRDLFPYPYTITEAKKWIGFNLNIDPPENMAIIVDGKVAGGLGVKRMEDIYRLNMEIGYLLGKDYWGKGITTEAVRQFVEYVFKTFDIRRIFAPVFEFNIASQKVLEKVGFRKEAILHHSLIKNGKFHNEIIYAILREEFKP